MAEQTPQKQYIVQRQGFPKADVWDEEKFNRSKDRFFNDFKEDGIAYEMAPLTQDYKIQDNDTFVVHRKGYPKADVWDAEKMRRSGQRFLKDFPDAEITRATPIDYWGDKLNEIYNRMGALEEELKGLPSAADNDISDLRNMSDEDLMQRAYTTKATGAAGARRRDINRELDQLRTMREQNPAWQRYWKAQNDEIDQSLARVEGLKQQDKQRQKGSAEDRLFSQFDNEYLRAAESFYNDAKKVVNAPSKYSGEEGLANIGSGIANFWQGVKDTGWSAISFVDLAKQMNNVNLLESIQKIQKNEGNDVNVLDLVNNHPERLSYMSDAEREMMKAFVRKAEVEGGRSETLSRMYQAGQGAAKSLGFMADFALAGGIGNAAAKTVAGELVKNAGRNAAKKIAADTLYGTVKALAMTPFMPSTYSNFIQNLTQLNDAGGVDLSGKKIAQSIGDVLIENVSETVGSKPLDVIGLPLSKVKFPAWAKAMRHSPIAGALKQAGYNGLFEEMVEEWTGNAMRSITGVDKDALKNYANWDQQLITLASFAPMSLLNGSISAVQYYTASKAMRDAGTALSDVLKKNGIDADLSSLRNYETPEELAHQLSGLYKQVVEKGGDAQEALRAVMKYDEALSRYNVMDGVFEEQKDIDRSRRLVEINNQLGNENWYHTDENGSSYVRTITDADGRENFVLADNEDGLALVDSEGKKTILGQDALAQGVADGSLQDSGEVNLSDYLDNRTEVVHRAQEAERMQEESAQNNRALFQRAQPGVNIGTENEPEIILQYGGGVFITQKGNEVKQYSQEEMANKLGIRLTPESEAEIEAKQEALDEHRTQLRDYLREKRGTPFIGPDGRQLTIVGAIRGRGEEKTPFFVFAKDENGRDVTLPYGDEDMDTLVAAISGTSAEASTTESEPAPAPAEPTVAVEDNVPRDFRGNPLPMRTNKQTGQQVVDGNTLWERDPEAWARWNDTNPNQRVGSRERLEYTIGELGKEIDKDTKAIQKAALKGTDEDEMDKMEQGLASKNERRNLLLSILNKYNLPATPSQTIAGEQRQAAAEQTIAEQQAGFPGIQQRWSAAPKVAGSADEIRLANGETLTGHYVLTEADAPTASHNPEKGYQMSEGFPVDENGRTVNDRDYERDEAAQKSVTDKAANYDQRALQTPVIVSADGVVLSGNDRTMASQIAAANNTDKAYTDYLVSFSQKFGFSADQVGQFSHPRVVFVPDAAMPYNAATFAKFNAEDKKSQSKTEKAVKAGKTISAQAVGQLATLINEYEDINALYNDAEGVDRLIDVLLADGIISQEQVAALKDGSLLSGTGMDMLESTLIGAALDEEAVRLAMDDRSLRKPIVTAIAQVIANNTLEGYTMRTELTDAVALVAAAKASGTVKFGESVQGYIRQGNLFGDDVIAEATVQMLADALNNRKTSFLKKVLSLYNRDAVEAANGQMSLLTNDVPSRDYIIRNVLEYLGYDTNIIYDTSQREAEQRAAEAADQTGNQSEEVQAGASVQGDAGSRVSKYDRERAEILLEQGNVGEIYEHLTDEEVAEFLRLMDEFEPSNDALGQAYTDLDADLKSKDKKVKKAAQQKIAELEAAQVEAFAPVQEYVDGLIDKYGLAEEVGRQEPAEQETEDEIEGFSDIEGLENDEEFEEDEDESEEEGAEEETPKKPNKKNEKAVEYKVKNAASEKTVLAQTYTQEELENFIFTGGNFSQYESKKTKEHIQVYSTNTHDTSGESSCHIVRRLPDENGDYYKGPLKQEQAVTADYLIKYFKANKFKRVGKTKAHKNEYGYWVNDHDVIVNPIRIEQPSVRKNWANLQSVELAQNDKGKWVIGTSFHLGSPHYSGMASGAWNKDKGFEKKSDAIREAIKRAEAWLAKSENGGKGFEEKDLAALIRALKSKTLPQALLEEGVVENVSRPEISASEFDNGVQGELFAVETESGTIVEPPAKKKTPKKRAPKKQAEKPTSEAAKPAEKEDEDEDEKEPKFTLEAEEGTPGNYHWVSERVCTNPTIITVPGDNREDYVPKVALAEKDGKWYEATFVTDDTGKGSAWGNVIPTFISSYIPYNSREEAVNNAISYIRLLINDRAKKNAVYGETFNKAKQLIDYLVKMEVGKKEEAQQESREDALRFIKNSLDNFAVNGNYARIVRTIEAYQDFFGDDVAEEIDAILNNLRANGISKESKDEMVRRVADLYNRLVNPEAESDVEQESAAPVVEEKPAAPAYGSQNTIITTEKYEELKRRMKEKLGQVNAGFDPETFFIGAQMAVYHVEAGARKFVDFAQRMISELGDAIRPYLKAIYNGARDLPGMEELRKEMDSAANVEAIDVDTIAIEQPEEATVEKKPAEQQPVAREIDVEGLFGAVNDMFQGNRDEVKVSDYTSHEDAVNAVREKYNNAKTSDEIQNIIEELKSYGEKVPDDWYYQRDYLSAIENANSNGWGKRTINSQITYFQSRLDDEQAKVVRSAEKKELKASTIRHYQALIDGYKSLLKEESETTPAGFKVGDEFDYTLPSSENEIFHVKVTGINDGFVNYHLSIRNKDERVIYASSAQLERDDMRTIEDFDSEFISVKIPEYEKQVEFLKAQEQSEQTSTIGEIGKYTHTKTGKEMSIVRLTGDRLTNDEFKALKARAKEYGGYYSSYGNAKGFLFDNEEDAIKFNTITNEENVRNQTDEQTAADTTAIVSEAASVAEQAQSLAENEEPAEPEKANELVAKIDESLDAINDQLALLGYYEAEQDVPFHEMYGYMKSAEKKAVKDADRLAKKLAADLGIKVGRKALAKANIAPAGGEVSFRLPLNEGHELYMCINLMPSGYQSGYGYEDNLVVRGTLGGGSLAIYFRVENPNESGQARYVTPNNNQPYNVSYTDLLKAIRRDARNYLPETTAKTEGPIDLVELAQEQAEKDRKSGKSGNKSVSSQEDGNALLGGLFADLDTEEQEAPIEESEAPAASVKPTEVNGFARNEKVLYTDYSGKTQEATIYDFEYDNRPVLDTGFAPVMYEVVEWSQIKKLETEPVNDTDNGLQRNDGLRTEGLQADNNRPVSRAQEATGGSSAEAEQESGRTDAGREGGSDLDTGSGRSLRRIPRLSGQNTHNNRIAKGEVVYPKTPAARFKANVAAIRLLKELQDSGKTANKAQMSVLRQYTGWGGLGAYFNNEYSPEHRELRSLLTDEEMQAAALSINTAYYTPVEVIDSMWDIAKRLGFEGGNVLEGSAGIGNILASMPKGISEHSAITAVELDNITGGILELLYPDAQVMIKGFEEAEIPNNSIDLAITNVPFGDNIKVYDPKEKDLTRKFGGKIHDFCIAKNVRKLRDGGIGIFISTRGTLDASSKALRQWIVNEGGADVIGAFRLNNATFEGTGATSDIIVVRKRVNGKASPNAINVSDTQITRRETVPTNQTEWNKNTRSYEPITIRAAMEINSYFVEHPENMGGEMSFGYEHNDSYRPASVALWPKEGVDQMKRLAKWVKHFAAEQTEPVATNAETVTLENEETANKEGQLIINSKGDICISRSGKAVPLGVNSQKIKGKYTKAQTLADYDALKTAINETLDYQLKNESDEGLKPLLAKLNKAYDGFVLKYGNLNRNTAISFLRNDVDFPSIAAVEDYKEKKDINGKVRVEVKKTSIFNGRVLGAKRVPTPSTAKDGVIVSINQFGRIDLPFIAGALGRDEDAVRAEILSSGLGFENPLTGELEVEYEYLSGNVREKLDYAREHNGDGRYDENIAALEKVIPADIPAHLIEFSLGSDWLPVELYTEYAKEKFGVTDEFVPTYLGGSWVIPENEWGMGVNTEKNRAAGVHSESLRMDKKGHELFVAAMNNTSVVFSRTYRDNVTGETHTETDKVATQAATTKMSEMREDFKEWCRAKMLEKPELSERIGKIYNDTFNAIVPKQIKDTFIPEHFEGQVLTMGKGNKPFHLYPHQAKAVIRATTEPLMMAHEVGAGKTFTLITTAMEMRRLGTAKKPMIVVQNATLGQFVSSAKELYPNAKVLTISEADRTVEGRSAFYAKIKYNDWDIIIVPQSVFEMMPDSEERQRAFIQEKIDEKKFILEQAKAAKNSSAERQLKKELEDLEYEYQYGEKPKKGNGSKKDAKKEAEAISNAAAKAKKQLDRRTDEVSDFDDMGIDALLVDEAHSYKHLGFSTAMQRGVKGVDATGSKKSAGVYLKTRAVFDKVGWKNVVFATGTPISNTAAEIWTFMKYLMPADMMRQHHIYYFDDFVRNFGNIAQSLEFTTSGKFKENTRFASYTNLPELIRIWSAVTDTVLAKDAAAAKTAEGKEEKLEDKLPKMEGGQAKDIYLPQSPSLVDIMTAIRARLEWYEGLTGKEKKENSSVPLVMFSLAKMAAIDPRLVDKSAPDEPNSKTNRAVQETLRALEDSKEYKGTCALFSDNFRRWDTDESGKRTEGFNIFEEIKRKLIEAGVPEDQIVIMKSGMTTAAKEKIFSRVNAGDVRVIMGTTATLGTGVNIQERLFFEAHLDAPNRPMDYTQRMGRILRQGNLHKDWGIPVRVVRFGVEDSLDVTAYQRLSTKSKFINSVMDGKPLLENGMSNRVLEEEEEGEFDNPVAVLSGSQYALLKSQAERELRKLRNKKEQHRQDQIYIERTLKENKNRVAYDEKLIEEARGNLAKAKAAFPDGAVKEITIEGRKAKGAEQIAETIKEKITGPLRERLERQRNNRGYSGEQLKYNITFGGVPVDVNVFVERLSEWNERARDFRTVMRTRLEYSCPQLGISERFIAGGYANIKDVVADFTERIATGAYFETSIANLSNTIARLNADNNLMLQRRGKPFAEEDKLAEQEKVVEDYTEKMKAEMAEKEAKYAEAAKNAKTSFTLDNVEIDEDEDGDGETSAEYSDMDGNGYFSGIEDRRDGEDANTFTERVVAEVTAKYPFLRGKIVTMSVANLSPERLSKLPNGLYNNKHKKITIFAKENRDSADGIERTIMHEAIHMLIHDFGWHKDRQFINLFNTALILSGYYSPEEYQEVFANVKATYEESSGREYTSAEIREEMVTHELSQFMLSGLANEFIVGAKEFIPELGAQLEKLVNTLGYEPRKESESRMDAEVLQEYREQRIIAARQRNAERRSVGDSGSESVLRDGATAGERGGERDVQGAGGEGPNLDEDGVSYEIVTDPETIRRLESGEKGTGYRNVVRNADGSLGSPMAGKLGRRGEKSVSTSSFSLNQWEKAEENPDMATEDGKINLIKPQGRGSVDGVDYNPYIHIRPTTLNKQFTQAWRRPELVYVETAFPSSELESGYKAEKAKLSVGRHPWNGGELILSRYDKPTRIVPWEEVADEWVKEYADGGVTFDIVPPELLPVLVERGVDILPPKKAAGQPAKEAYEEWRGQNPSRNRVAYHGSAANFDKFDKKFMGTGEGSQAYGAGIYVTGVRSTGRMYAGVAAVNNDKSEYNTNGFRQRINDTEWSIRYYTGQIADWKNMLETEPLDNEDRERIEKRIASAEEHVAKMRERLQDMNSRRAEHREYLNRLMDFENDLEDRENSPRHLYTVEIPEDSGGNYLGWEDDLTDEQIERIIAAAQKQKGQKWDNVVESLTNRIKEKKLDRSGEAIELLLSLQLSSNMASNLLKRAGFVGMKVKTGQQNGGDGRGWNYVIYSPKDIKITGHERFRMAEGVEGLLSNAEEVVKGITQEKATPGQWLKMIESRGGLKAGEDKWIGLSDWLDASDKKTLTKQEVLDYINANKIQIEETSYSEGGNIEQLRRDYPTWDDAFYIEESDFGVPDARIEDLEAAVELYNTENITSPWLHVSDGDLEEGDEGYDRLLDWANDLLREYTRGNINPIRLDYTTSNLANKREIALTVPTIEPWNQSDEVHFGDAGEGRAVAWIRFGDATIDGNRVLVIDEIQSKRHQSAREKDNDGREKGYKDAELERKANRRGELSRKSYSEEGLTFEEHKEFKALQEELYNYGEANVEKNRNAIPAAPFEKNWHELAMKRMLRLAAEEGYDYVAWTTGEQQAERYTLSNTVQSILSRQDGDVKNVDIELSNRNYTIELKVDGDGHVTSSNESEFSGKNLSDIVGKDNAKKLLAEDTTIEGDNIKIGGEGMKGFYDDILPRFMNKYGKKWGVKVEDIALPALEESARIMHAVPVTQEMKESVMTGQLMFREGTESATSPVSYTESMGAKRLAVNRTANQCGIEIEFRPSAQMMFEGKPLAGRWINGKMYICLEHCRDAADAVRTVLHEGVGHNGLRKLIGNENMREFCLDMISKLPVSARREIADAAVNKYGANIAEAVEEYLAEKAEVMDFENEDYERGFWDIVRDGLRRVLVKIGINIPLSQRDVRWLMWQSYNANKQGDLLNEAKRQVVANKLGFTLRQQADKAAVVQASRNRLAEEELAPAARIYNKDVLYWASRLRETWVDKDDSVQRLVGAIEKATGKKAESFEDVRLALNQQSSKGLAAIEKFDRKYWVPMKESIKKLMGEKGCDLSDIERYVMIKHGLERNEVFARRDAREFYQDAHDSAVASIEKALEDGKIDGSARDMLVAKEDAKLEKNLKAVEAGSDVKYKEFRKQDYGGLTAMYSEYDAFEPYMEGVESWEEYQSRVLQARHPKYTYIDEVGKERVDMAATEAAAQKEVEEFEAGFQAGVDELWKRINAATKATLKHQYDANMISRKQYLQVRDMFNYYVPLRGFADNTAEDMYDYYRSDQRNDFTPPLQKAVGRKTEAESPFGYIGAMASSGIAADMKNETKLALYYFVSNRAANDLVTISEVWYKVTGADELGRKIFSPVYPPLTEDLGREEAKRAYEDWEKRMEEEAKAGLAFKGSHKLNLHNSVIHIDKSQAASHVIKFKVGGRDMMMYINGNPRAAQAINNELNVEMSADYQKVFGKVLRWFSGINTSYNPEFWLSNAQRDALFAIMSVDVKEDSEYGRAFRKNFGSLLAKTLTPGAKNGAFGLLRKLEDGTLGDSGMEALYREFVENGGVTGYTTLKNNEEWEQELRKYTGRELQTLKSVKSVFESVQKYGEAIEQMTRFAAYMTSRGQGKDIKGAVNDAKELTVNFNRKGSGKAISWKEADRLRTKDGKKLTAIQKALVVGASWLPVYGRRFIMFFNASTQGLNAMYRLFKSNPGRTGTWAAGFLALGVLQAVIHALMDDDDDYLDIPDYERRNNLLLGGKGVYLKWALPQEVRVFYAIGDMAVNHALGREPHKYLLSEIAASALDVAPLNPSGGLSALAPSALAPVVEVIQNRDYKGAKIYNDLRYLSDEERKRTPGYQKAYQSTAKRYVLISQFANWATGGDYADAGWLNINPAVVEHLVEGATGGAGTTVKKVFDTVENTLSGEFQAISTPFVRRVLAVTDDRYRNAHTTELFDFYKAEAEHTKKRLKTYQKDGDIDKLDKLMDSDDYDIMLIYDSYKGQLKYYSDELKYTDDKKERKALMREQDEVRKEMIMEISNIGKND